MELVQYAEIIINYLGEGLLLIVGALIFSKVSKPAGVAVLVFGLLSLIYTLSFSGVDSLEFIAEALTDFEEINGKVVPTLPGGLLGVISSISKLALAVGIYALFKQALNNQRQSDA